MRLQTPENFYNIDTSAENWQKSFKYYIESRSPAQRIVKQQLRIEEAFELLLKE
jgi:hypothetical protein